jgi:hypothetical protein
LRRRLAEASVKACGVYDVVRSLLARPDEKSLALLLKVIPFNSTGESGLRGRKAAVSASPARRGPAMRS